MFSRQAFIVVIFVLYRYLRMASISALMKFCM